MARQSEIIIVNQCSHLTISLLEPHYLALLQTATAIVMDVDGVLTDGSVLITGGTDHVRYCGRGGCHGTDTVLSTAELFK